MENQIGEFPRPRILIVEDQRINAERLRINLEQLGYETCGIVARGEEAVQKAEDTRPDLILMDIRLKGEVDGIEAAQRVRSRLNIPIVFLTAHADERAIDRAKTAEPYGYLVKPYRVEELRSTIAIALFKHKADTRIRETEQRLELALMGADLGLWDLNLQTGEAFYAPGSFSMLGYSDDEIEPRMSAWEVLVHPDDADRVRKTFSAHAKGTFPLYECEYRMRNKAGEWRWIKVRGKITERDIHGNPLRMIGTLCDVTPRKTAELMLQEAHDELEKRVMERTAKLTESNAKLQKEMIERKRAQEVQRLLAKAIEQSIESVMITDRSGNIRYVNPAFERISGYNRKEVVGQKPGFLKSDQHDSAFYKDMAATIGSGKAWKGRFLSERKDGKPYHADVTISPVRSSAGQIENYVALGHDVTEQVQLERQLLQAQKMEAIGTLAGGIAHDFNNLLQIIVGYSDLVLFDQTEKDTGHKELQAIRQAASRGADLVRQILTFSRRVETNPSPMNLNTEVKQAHKLLARTISKMIDIQLLLADGLNKINADPSQIEQILLNLAVNAQHAMPEGGKIVIQTENVTLDAEYCETHFDVKPGGYALLTVSDTGHGMEKEVQDHIFEPFYTTKGPGEGTGLGLAMVFGIVKGHGGHIACESGPGLGTTFKIYLPVMEMEETLEVAGSGEMPAFGAETILLVDDEESLLDLGEQLLTRAGYTVLKARSGKEALEIYREKKDLISLVILDLIMPVMEGTQCMEEILKVNPKAKILLASGCDTDEKKKQLVEARAKGFVVKPYRVKKILRTIREVLDAD